MRFIYQLFDETEEFEFEEINDLDDDTKDKKVEVDLVTNVNADDEVDEFYEEFETS